jgi:hypothetical protein
MGSGGAVVRVGSTVRRPWRPWSDAVRVVLEHLEQVGFDGTPRYLGRDEHGREVLTYLEGDVGVPPFPAWVADDELLVSVAELQRRLHDAMRTFVAPEGAAWDTAYLPPAGHDAVVCHNDLCVENVVVQGGRAVGFIDFDFAAPASPLYDITIAARHWVPYRAPEDLDEARAGVDQIARFGRFCDAHGLDRAAREEVVGEGIAFLDRALVAMRARAESGLPLYVATWEQGYPEQNRRSRAWLEREAGRLVAA